MNTNNSKPLAQASAMPGTSAWTIAVFPADKVPVGTDIYAQLPDSRLRLEVEVANDNAQHWKANLQQANERGDSYRTQRNDAKKTLAAFRIAVAETTGITSIEQANKILEEDSWRSGESSAIARLARIYLAAHETL